MHGLTFALYMNRVKLTYLVAMVFGVAADKSLEMEFSKRQTIYTHSYTTEKKQ